MSSTTISFGGSRLWSAPSGVCAMQAPTVLRRTTHVVNRVPGAVVFADHTGQASAAALAANKPAYTADDRVPPRGRRL